MHDTELVYTKNRAHDHKTMLLVAVPASSAAAAGKHMFRKEGLPHHHDYRGSQL